MSKKQSSIPAFKKTIQNIKKHYANWLLKIYYDEDIFKIVDVEYPEWSKLIRKAYPGAVLADVFRYLILYLEGGIYCDADCVPLRNFERLLNGGTEYHGDHRHNYTLCPDITSFPPDGWSYLASPCSNMLNFPHQPSDSDKSPVPVANEQKSTLIHDGSQNADDELRHCQNTNQNS